MRNPVQGTPTFGAAVVAAVAIAGVLTSAGSAVAGGTTNVPCGGGGAALAAAITAANSSSDADTLLLDANCTYTLTAAGNASILQGPNGLPVVTSPITIIGSSSTITRSSASDFRLPSG